MVDAWEIFGRLATDDAFRRAIFKGPFQPHYAIDKCCCAIVLNEDYDRARDIINQHGLRGRPISLMALGELLVARTVQGFMDAVQKLASSITDAAGSLNIAIGGRSVLFYTAFGAMIVDKQFRSRALASANAFDLLGFCAVLPADRTDLRQLFGYEVGEQKTMVVSGASDQFCNLFWEPHCNLRTVFYLGHVHPVANPQRLRQIGDLEPLDAEKLTQ